VLVLVDGVYGVGSWSRGFRGQNCRFRFQVSAQSIRGSWLEDPLKTKAIPPPIHHAQPTAATPPHTTHHTPPSVLSTLHTLHLIGEFITHVVINELNNKMNMKGKHKSFRMVALDLDGTLLNSKHELNEEVASYLRRLHEKGVIIAIATGRCVPT
jgi:hypothetical protein